jgi:hypothetical protein
MMLRSKSHRMNLVAVGLACLVAALLGGCPQGEDLLGQFAGPAFRTADFAGTWDLELEGLNPYGGQRGTDTAYVVIDADGYITESSGPDLVATLFQQGRLEFSDTSTGAVKAYVAVPLIGDIEMGTGDMSASKRSMELYFPINDGTVFAIKR